MRESDHKEEFLAVDYALDLLDPDRKRAFIEEMDGDAELAREVRTLESAVCDMTLAAPQLIPDPSNIEAILRRVSSLEDSGIEQDEGNTTSAAPSPPQTRLRFLMWSGWGVAACLTIIAAFLAVNDSRKRKVIARLESGNPAVPTGAIAGTPGDGSEGSQIQPAPGDNEESAQEDQTLLAAKAESIGDDDRPPSQGRNENDEVRYLLQRSMEQLQRELAVMGDVRNERFQAIAGLSRLVVIEMHGQRNLDPSPETTGPDSSPNTGPDEPDLGTVIASAVVDGLTGSGPDSQTFESFGQSVPPLGLEATPARPEDVPNENGIDPIPENPDNTDGPGDNAPETPVLPVDPNQEQASEPLNSTLLTAYALYDETTGEGSVLVQDLPVLENNLTYQLWMVDPMEENPVSVGLLPALDTGSNRLFFKLENQQSPSEFFITEEPEGGSRLPTGNALVSGPDR
jgi:anti-sigma-K factor RskA